MISKQIKIHNAPADVYKTYLFLQEVHVSHDIL